MNPCDPKTERVVLTCGTCGLKHVRRIPIAAPITCGACLTPLVVFTTDKIGTEITIQCCSLELK